MLGYIIRRLLGAIPTLFIIIAATFFLMRLAPGGPFDGERRLPPEIERNIKAAYNLDKPVVEQFGLYLGKLVQGDFGPSFKNKDFSVSELIALGESDTLARRHEVLQFFGWDTSASLRGGRPDVDVDAGPPDIELP